MEEIKGNPTNYIITLQQQQNMKRKEIIIKIMKSNSKLEERKSIFFWFAILFKNYDKN